MTGDATQTAPPAGADGGVARGEGLLLVAGEGLVTFPLLRDEITIGRAPECDIVIANSALSRRHVRLQLAPTMTVEDLGSRNGTRLRGSRLEPGRALPLAVGEAFQIGQLHFVVARARSNPSLASASASAHAESLRVVDPTPAAVSAFVRELAASALSILVLGETGVGKEVLAQTIHDLSNRRGAFVRANCAAMAPSLVESELFGHEKSAFTGASERRVGLLEAAQHGTFFLDEVGELPEAIQVKLLRAIEAREITRIGAVTPIALDVRFVAATNRDLAAEVDAGRFRRDLFYRLDGVTLGIPPLREHRERIGPLALQFLAAAKGGVPQALDAALLARLEAHDWPGNVRELKAVIERAAILAGGGPIKPRHVAITPIKGQGEAPPNHAAVTTPEAVERQRIVDALEACAGNQTRAAKLLGMSRATLVTKLAIHRIQRPRK
ncbi:MAG TPA: sigma 54-interacting transcriptional regulator [Kofleriaceae bacterium]|nr:sigma 54-interacting transcriptional regulator [Kofleriaceae bacterium]